MIFQIRTLTYERFKKKIGDIDYSDFKKIKLILQNYLDL
ncbi:MAG: hypothetical protein ACTSVY_03065 [Candidatus Helarchaeota archaeon]